MKHPTDEEIEKFVLDETAPLYDGIEARNIRAAMRLTAKWARDQQPKLKTLLQIGWEVAPGKSAHIVDTPYCSYLAEPAHNHDMKLCIMLKGSQKWEFVSYASDLEKCKQLAQADYEKRVNELYV